MSDWLHPQEPLWKPSTEEENETVQELLQVEETPPPVAAVQQEPAIPPVPPVQTQPVVPVPTVQTGWQQPTQSGWQQPYAPSYTPGYQQPSAVPYGATPPAYVPPQVSYTPQTYMPQTASGDKAGKPKRSRAVPVLLAAIALVAVASIVVAAVLVPWSKSTSSNGGKTPGSSSGGTNPGIVIDTKEPLDEGLSTMAIVEKNLDSTVVITMYDKVSSGGWGGMGGGRSTEQQVGAASGIVWSADGYIITNAHVVANEDAGREYSRIVVTLYDETEYEATIIGYDTHTDLAVIKVSATDLKPAEFGQSTQLRLGERLGLLL